MFKQNRIHKKSVYLALMCGAILIGLLVVQVGWWPAAAAAAPETVSTAYQARPVSTANLSIESMTCTAKKEGNAAPIETVIRIKNRGDDDARHVHLIVTLPHTSRVRSTDPEISDVIVGPSFKDSSPWLVQGYVMFNLSKPLGVGEEFTAKVETQMVADRINPDHSIGALLYGSLPDPIGSNNYQSCPIVLTD